MCGWVATLHGGGGWQGSGVVTNVLIRKGKVAGADEWQRCHPLRNSGMGGNVAWRREVAR